MEIDIENKEEFYNNTPDKITEAAIFEARCQKLERIIDLYTWLEDL